MQDPRHIKHRLHALCPYFAMFPPEFARENLMDHSNPEDVVLDPFSGRGTVLLEALLNDRVPLACDTNPVAYCVSAAKAMTPTLFEVTSELGALVSEYLRRPSRDLDTAQKELPAFFAAAFQPPTLRQILFLRRRLRWNEDPVHRFICALVLGHLHGEMDRSDFYLSNQMPHSISTKPAYSIKYWSEHGLTPPKRDVFEVLIDRAAFRLAHDMPAHSGVVAKCDARAAASNFREYWGTVSCVITSPPYLDVTCYGEDQWLRMWFLGGHPYPTYGVHSKDDRHTSNSRYWAFLSEVWRGIQPLLTSSARLICRIGAKSLDEDEISRSLTDSLRESWPKVQMLGSPRRTDLVRSQSKNLVKNVVGCPFELDLTYVLPC